MIENLLAVDGDFDELGKPPSPPNYSKCQVV